MDVKSRTLNELVNEIFGDKPENQKEEAGSPYWQEVQMLQNRLADAQREVEERGKTIQRYAHQMKQMEEGLPYLEQRISYLSEDVCQLGQQVAGYKKLAQHYREKLAAAQEHCRRLADEARDSEVAWEESLVPYVREKIAIQEERDQLLLLMARGQYAITVRQFVNYCHRPWEADAWEWYENLISEYAKRGMTLMREFEEHCCD